MSHERRLVAGLDTGSTKTCAVVAEVVATRDEVLRVESLAQEEEGEGVTLVACSDGEDVWAHLDHERFTGELPAGTDWVEASLEEWQADGVGFGVRDALLGY